MRLQRQGSLSGLFTANRADKEIGDLVPGRLVAVRWTTSHFTITRRHRKASLRFLLSFSCLFFDSCTLHSAIFNSFSPHSHSHFAVSINKATKINKLWPPPQKTVLHLQHRAPYPQSLPHQLTPTPARRIPSPLTTSHHHPHPVRHTPCSQNPISKPAKPHTLTSFPQQNPTVSRSLLSLPLQVHSEVRLKHVRA